MCKKCEGRDCECCYEKIKGTKYYCSHCGKDYCKDCAELQYYQCCEHELEVK